MGIKVVSEITLAVAILVSATGCTTIPMSNIRDDERVVVTFSKPAEAPKATQRGWKDVVANVARVAAYAAYTEAADVYGGSYGGSVSGNFVNFSTNKLPNKSVSGILRMDRFIGTYLVCRVDIEVIPVSVANSTKGYFKLAPKRVAMSCTKAKLTESFGADSETMNIKVTSRFPSAGQKDGSVDCVYGFSLLNIKPGVDFSFNGGPSSDVFEVASEGPVTFSVDVVEETKIIGFWKTISTIFGN